MKPFYIVAAALFLAGCSGYMINSSINRFNRVSDNVELGQSKEEVFEILGPSQEGLKPEHKKKADRMMVGTDLIEIYYCRSARIPDGASTDDEFTPYRFKNGKLISIGWAALGGPKTQGRVPESDHHTVIIKNPPQ